MDSSKKKQNLKTLISCLLPAIFLLFTACSQDSSLEPMANISNEDLRNGEMETSDDSKTAEASYEVLLSMSQNGDSACTFGDVSGCKWVKLDVEWDGTSFNPVLDSVEWGNDTVLQSTYSPSGNSLAGTTTANQNISMQSLKLFAEELPSDGDSDLISSSSSSVNGTWPTWIDENTLMFSKTNTCTTRDCDKEQKSFSKLYTYSVESSETELFLDDSWANCDMADPYFAGDFFAGHGSTSSASFDDECPLTSYVPLQSHGKDYGPQPFIAEWVNGEPEFYPFDLEGAGINACAHFAGDNGLWICTEQNTMEEPYRLCSDPSLSLSDCKKNGGHNVLYNRTFGWKLNEETQQMESVNGDEPLFEHLHPTELPGADGYFFPEEEECQVYKTKQSTLLENTMLTHIYCQSKQEGNTSAEMHSTKFSRAMLIQFANPEEPVYFDLTGWFEENFSDRFAPGEATSYTSTMKILNK